MGKAEPESWRALDHLLDAGNRVDQASIGKHSVSTSND
ncbi:MAG: hypothetical protein ACI9R3_005342 [Verrucomicrobiales bacterium]|jgi:hypothetical protein